MEIELKLALHPRHIANIQRHPLLNTIKSEKRPLLSIYFDTPQFDLMHRGIALRVRRVDDQWIQTLKAATQSVGALSSRPEWEMAIADGSHADFSALPQAALDLLAGIKQKHIAPVFTTEFQRITWQIGNDTTRAEVALDSGKIHAGETYRDICEVEIELKSGTPEFLFEVAAQLLQQVPLHVEPRSKAERGYVLCGAINSAPTKAVQPIIEKHQSVGEAWNAILQSALIQLVANVPGFLENAHDIEYLHQLRVALRRMQTGVILAKSLGQATANWSQPLRKLMRTLNLARDWDVFRQETLPKILSVLEVPAKNTTVNDAVLILMHDTATHARQRAQALLLKPAFTQLVLDIGRSLLTTPMNAQIPDAKTWAGTILEQRWQKLRKRCHGFARLNPAERHMARIATKKMRYAAEAFAPPYDKRTDHFITALAALQDELGYANDLRIGMQLLRKLPRQSVTLSFELGRLSGALEFEAAQHGNPSSAIWQRLARSKLFWR